MPCYCLIRIVASAPNPSGRRWSCLRREEDSSVVAGWRRRCPADRLERRPALYLGDKRNIRRRRRTYAGSACADAVYSGAFSRRTAAAQVLFGRTSPASLAQDPDV